MVAHPKINRKVATWLRNLLNSGVTVLIYRDSLKRRFGSR